MKDEMNHEKKTPEERKKFVDRARERLGGFFSKISFSALLANKRLLQIISIIIAFVIWATVSTGAAVIESRTIKDVPIDFDSDSTLLTEYALRLVSADVDAVDVTITGPRYVISAMTADNITVSANTSGVSEPGQYTLSLRASVSNGNTSVTAQVKSVENASALYDQYSSETLTLEAVDDGKLTYADNYTGTVTVNPTSVTVTGPKSLVSTIKSAEVHYNAGEDPLENDVQLNSAINLVDASGDRVTSKNLTTDISGVSISIEVLKVKTVALGISLRNAPEGYMDDFVTISPTKVRIAGAAETVDAIDTILLGANIDVSGLYDSYSFTLPLDLEKSTGSAALVNLDGVEEVSVNIDYSDARSKTFSVSAFSFDGTTTLEDKYTFSVLEESLSDVTVFAKRSVMSSLKSSDLEAVITIDPNNFTTGSTQYTVTVISKSGKQVWAVGEYKATVSVTRK